MAAVGDVDFPHTLCEVLIQVELESSAAESKHLTCLCEEAVVCQDIVAHWVGQQQSPHIPTLAFYSTGGPGRDRALALALAAS